MRLDPETEICAVHIRVDVPLSFPFQIFSVNQNPSAKHWSLQIHIGPHDSDPNSWKSFSTLYIYVLESPNGAHSSILLLPRELYHAQLLCNTLFENEKRMFTSHQSKPKSRSAWWGMSHFLHLLFSIFFPYSHLGLSSHNVFSENDIWRNCN